MPAVAIYRVSVSGDNHSYVQWTECEGNTPPPRLINSRLRTIVFEAQGTTAVLNSISKSAAATIEMIGVANPNCSGTGNDESLTTTTTIAITTTAAPTTTTTLAPATISLGYNVSSALTACGASPSNYYARNGYGLDNGTQLFTNSGLTTFAPNGYYSNGTDYYTHNPIQNGDFSTPSEACDYYQMMGPNTKEDFIFLGKSHDCNFLLIIIIILLKQISPMILKEMEIKP